MRYLFLSRASCWLGKTCRSRRRERGGVCPALLKRKQLPGSSWPSPKSFILFYFICAALVVSQSCHAAVEATAVPKPKGEVSFVMHLPTLAAQSLRFGCSSTGRGRFFCVYLAGRQAGCGGGFLFDSTIGLLLYQSISLRTPSRLKATHLIWLHIGNEHRERTHRVARTLC